MKKKSTLLSCAALLALTSLQSLPARELFRLVRLEDDAAAGTTGSFATFSKAIINNSEKLAYLGSLKRGSGVNTSNNDGIWRDDASAFSGTELNSREGFPAPGAPGTTFTNLVNSSTFQINDSGDIVYRASLRGAGVDNDNNVGIWYQAAGSSTPLLVAREGDAAPGTDGVFNVVGLPAQSDTVTGEIYFKADLRGGTVTNNDDSAIYGYIGGTLTLIYREGDATPPLPVDSATAAFGEFLEQVSVSSDGKLLFAANIRNVASNSNSGLFLRDSGATSLLIQEDTPLPDAAGAPTSALITNYRAFSINDSGQILVRVSLRANVGGVDSTNNEAIITTTGGFLRLLAREGDLPPDGGTAIFRQFRIQFIGNTGATALACLLDGNVDSLYSAENSGTLVNIAREGIAAPGSDGTYNVLSRPAMNHAGQLLYSSTLTGGTTSSADNAGLWRTSAIATPPTSDELISRRGDFEDDICGNILSYEVNSPTSPNGGVSGTGRAINDNDNLVVTMITNSPGFGSTEGVYVLGDNPAEFCEPPKDELRNVTVGSSVAVSWIAPIVIDDDTVTPPTVVSTHSSGDTFGPGVTVVTYTATDSSGHVSTYRFRVIITEIRDLNKLLTPDFVVSSGDLAPPADEFKVFSRVCLNDSGNVTFEASTASNLRGVWSNGTGPLVARALTGDVLGSANMDRFSDITILPSGWSAFTTVLAGATPLTDTANIIQNSTNNSLVGLEGDDAPDASGSPSGSNYRQIYEQAVSQSASTNYSVYPARLRTDIGTGTTGNDTGIWFFDADVATGSVKMVQEGDTVAPIPGLTHGNIPQRTVTGGALQRFAYTSLLAGPGVDSGNNQALFVDRPTTAATLLLRRGDLAPGPDSSIDASSNWKKATSTLEKIIRRDSGRFRTFLAEAISPDGLSVAVHASLMKLGSINNDNDTGIWMIDSSNLPNFVAREGHQAPGFPEGVRFDRFENLVVTNDGELWFRAYLEHDAILGINSSNDCGIWSNSDGLLRFFLHEGELAPNTDGGIVRSINGFSYDEEGFAATLTLVPGTGDALPNNNLALASGLDALTGLFQTNVRKGDQFEESAGIFRTLTLVDIETPFNAAGGSGGFCNSVSGVTQQVVLKASFQGNGNGVILRDLTDVGP